MRNHPPVCKIILRTSSRPSNEFTTTCKTWLPPFPIGSVALGRFDIRPVVRRRCALLGSVQRLRVPVQRTGKLKYDTDLLIDQVCAIPTRRLPDAPQEAPLVGCNGQRALQVRARLLATQRVISKARARRLTPWRKRAGCSGDLPKSGYRPCLRMAICLNPMPGSATGVGYCRWRSAFAAPSPSLGTTGAWFVHADRGHRVKRGWARNT